MGKIRRTKIPRKASGIYQICSKINGKIYIGSAVNLEKRKYEHFYGLECGEHHNFYLQRHVNKYGIKDLQFSIIEFCQKKKLIEREQYYLDTLQPDFNICKIAYSCLGVKHSEEAREKIRKWHIGRSPSKDTLKKLSESHKGFVMPQKQKEKMRQSLLGHRCSEETKQKISKANIGKKRRSKAKNERS